MRFRPYFGIRIPLPFPFYAGIRIKRSRHGLHGRLPNGRPCPHNHSRQDLADACTARYARAGRTTP